MASEIQEAPLLKEKYPAKAHARKLAEWIKTNGGEGKGVIYLEGQKDKLIEVYTSFHSPNNGSHNGI